MDAFDDRKIVDPELKDFASSGVPSERRSVIVEPGGAPPQLAPRGTFGGPGPSSVRSPRPALLTHDEGAVGGPEPATAFVRLALELKSLDFIEEPLALKFAEVFVVSVTPEQLRKLSLLAHSGIIRPNREHKLPPVR